MSANRPEAWKEHPSLIPEKSSDSWHFPVPLEQVAVINDGGKFRQLRCNKVGDRKVYYVQGKFSERVYLSSTDQPIPRLRGKYNVFILEDKPAIIQYDANISEQRELRTGIRDLSECRLITYQSGKLSSLSSHISVDSIYGARTILQRQMKVMYLESFAKEVMIIGVAKDDTGAIRTDARLVQLFPGKPLVPALDEEWWGTVPNLIYIPEKSKKTSISPVAYEIITEHEAGLFRAHLTFKRPNMFCAAMSDMSGKVHPQVHYDIGYEVHPETLEIQFT